LESLPVQISVVVVDEDQETVASFRYVDGDKVAKGTINDFINADEVVNIECNLEN
jgi:hypothetical protein